jgi:hypothetical protein
MNIAESIGKSSTTPANSTSKLRLGRSSIVSSDSFRRDRLQLPGRFPRVRFVLTIRSSCSPVCRRDAGLIVSKKFTPYGLSGGKIKAVYDQWSKLREKTAFDLLQARFGSNLHRNMRETRKV